MAKPLSSVRRTAISLALATTLTTATAVPLATPAQAIVHCYACEVECVPAAPSAWGSATTLVAGSIEAMGLMVSANIGTIIQMLQLLSVDVANTGQAQNNTRMALSDKEVANETAINVTKGRSELMKASIPSSRACALSTSSEKIPGRLAKVSGAVKTSEGNTNTLLSNGSGTPGEKGELAYNSSLYKNRNDKYCDPKEVASCTPTVGTNADLNVAPIFTNAVLDTTQYDTAKDTIKNLIGPDVVDDPVRGPALASNAGQTMSLLSREKQARANFVASVLTNIVEDRNPDANGASALKEAEELARVDSDVGAKSLVKAQGQTDEQSEAEIDAAMEAISNQLLKLRGTFEKIALIRAVGMATDIQVNRKIGRAAITMQGN